LLEGQVLESSTQELVRNIANILIIILDTIKKYIISEGEINDKSSCTPDLTTNDCSRINSINFLHHKLQKLISLN